MALAEKLHHTSRGQRFARAGEEGREEHDALRRQRRPPPQPELFQLYEEEPGGSRPVCLVAPRGPQEKVQQCAVEQLADVVPMVQVLDAPGLLGEVVVVDLLRELDAPALDELVIAVPKISLDRIPQRCPRRRPRRAEQLVEVLTIISYSSLQLRDVEQTIDIPVPHDRGGRGGGGGLQGFSQRQGATAFRGAEFVDIPVPQGRGGVEVFKVSPRNRAQQRFMDQITLIFQFLTVVLEGEVFKASSQDRVQLLLHLTLVLRKKLGMGFFALFAGGKKVRSWVRTRGSELGADFNPWTPAAYAEHMAGADDEFEAESEAEAEVEEDAETRFAAGFRPMGSACSSSRTSWDGQCGGVPMAIGAPSHTHGLSFTRKPQPMSSSSPRTFGTEAVVAASGPGGGVVWR